MAGIIHGGRFPFSDLERNRIRDGDIIAFGRYVENADSDPVPVLWRFLCGVSCTEGILGVFIAVNGIDALPYSDDADSCTWENSSLRKWLHGYFYENAFDEEERSYITEFNGDLVSIPNDWTLSLYVSGEANYCTATPYAADKLADNPVPLYRRIETQEEIYGKFGKIVQNVPSADFYWVSPYRLNLFSSSSEQDDDISNRSRDCNGEINVMHYLYTETDFDGKSQTSEWCEMKRRKIGLKALVRPMICLHWHQPGDNSLLTRLCKKYGPDLRLMEIFHNVQHHYVLK